MQDRLTRVRERIEAAKKNRDSTDEVRLVAVSKTHDVEAMKVLYDEGVRSFGESYVQEWQEKVDEMPSDTEWHFVGRLQSNKARFLADRVRLIHSVDRKSLKKALNRRGEGRIDVLLQVNLGLQDTKGGVALEELEKLMDRATHYPGIRVRGLMGIPPYSSDPEETRPYFQRLRQALEDLQGYVEGHHGEHRAALTELSMGMSNDFEVAIEEGATIIRLGTALFGQRDYDDTE